MQQKLLGTSLHKLFFLSRSEQFSLFVMKEIRSWYLDGGSFRLTVSSLIKFSRKFQQSQNRGIPNFTLFTKPKNGNCFHINTLSQKHNKSNMRRK